MYGVVAENTFVRLAEIGIHKFVEVAFGLFRKRSKVNVERCCLDIEVKQTNPCYSICYTGLSSILDSSRDVFGCETSLSSTGKGNFQHFSPRSASH